MPTRLLTLFLPSLLACSSPQVSADAHVPSSPPEHPWLVDKPLNIAHRGGGLLAPEETMVAYENAVALGVDVLEMDVHATSDGVLVLMHDSDVERTTDGEGKIGEMTYAEALLLDAGYEYSADGEQTFPYRGTGVTVATMREVLEAFPEMLFAIETKEFGLTEPILDLVEELGMEDQVVLAGFFDQAVRNARAYNPNVLTAMTIEESLAFVRMTDEELAVYDPPAWALQAPPSLGDLVVDRALVERADRFGIKVHVWTVNEREEMQDFLDMGIHGIMSDDPATLADLL